MPQRRLITRYQRQRVAATPLVAGLRPNPLRVAISLSRRSQGSLLGLSCLLISSVALACELPGHTEHVLPLAVTSSSLPANAGARAGQTLTEILAAQHHPPAFEASRTVAAKQTTPRLAREGYSLEKILLLIDAGHADHEASRMPADQPLKIAIGGREGLSLEQILQESALEAADDSAVQRGSLETMVDPQPDPLDTKSHGLNAVSPMPQETEESWTQLDYIDVGQSDWRTWAVVEQPAGKRVASDNGLIEFDFDETPNAEYRLSDHWFFGARVQVEAQHEHDFDLDNEEDDDSTPIQPEVRVAMVYRPDEQLSGVLEFDLEQQFDIEEPSGQRSDDLELELKQANITYRDFAPGWSVQVGRQNFEDEREWIFDDKLDALRLYYRAESFGMEVSASRKDIVDRDLLNNDREERINNYLWLGRYAYDDDEYIDGYVLYRDDKTDDNEDLTFFGLRNLGEIGDLEYWVDLAHVRGDDGDDKLRGYGMDVGMIFEFDHSWRPALTLAGAFGTGDDDTTDGKNEAFRQTGLHDNDGKFNGFVGFKYYGEVLDPELSNLAIATLGFGLRPTKDLSLDVIYHHYRQHHPEDELQDSNLDEDPEGNSRNLGDELDFVFGYRGPYDIRSQFTFGLFEPGRAFDDDADRAWFAELKVTKRF